MRHRFKLWKYNSYNADEAETMLNQMAEAGWKLKNISNVVSFAPCIGIRPQYTIEVLPPIFWEADNLEETKMKEFYEQLGWNFVKRISNDGMYLFINESGRPIPHAYYDKTERMDLLRSRVNWGFIIGGVVGFIIMYFLWFHDLDLDTMEFGFLGGISISLCMALLMGMWISPALAALSYKKLGRENLFTRIDAWWDIIWNGIIVLLILLEIPMNGYLMFSGQFMNHMEGDIIGHFSVYCSLLAPILWLSGTCFALTADRKWLRVTGTLLSTFGYLGGLMGMAYIGLQLGLIS